MSALGVDTRSDIYSLGVLLYELLTGSTPLSPKRVKEAAYAEILRLIKEEEPPRPSTRLSDSGEALASISAQRHMEPAKLTKLVRGELDWIVMKCLEKDRGRRYETAKDFAADVQRYLNDEPVQACPPSAMYRLRKFARRNKRALAMGAVVAVAVLIAATALGWAMRDREAREQEIALETARKVALTEQGIRQALDRASRSRAELHAILKKPGGVQLLLNQPARWELLIKTAQGELAQAGHLAARDEGSLDAEWTGAMDQLAQQLRSDHTDYNLALRLEKIRLDSATVVNRPFDNRKAADEYLKAFAGLAVLSDDPATVAARIASSPIKDQLVAALDDWALVAFCLRKKDLVEQLLALARQAAPDPDWGDRLRQLKVWRDQEALGKLVAKAPAGGLSPQLLYLVGYLLRDDKPLNESWLRQGQAEHPADFWLSFQLGLALLKTNPVEAAGFNRLALAVRPGSCLAYNNLGVSLQHQQKLPQAIAAYNKAIKLDPKYALAYHNLGNALRAQQKLPQANAAYRKAMAAYREAIKIEPKYPFAHNNLGNLLRDQKKLDEAIACYKKAIELDPKYAYAYNGLGAALRAQQKLPEAIACFRKAIEIDPKAAYAHIGLGNVLHDQKRLPEAIACYRKGIEIDPKNAVAYSNLGRALGDQKKIDEAIAACRKAMELDPKYAKAHINLGIVLHDKKKLPEAIACFRKAIEIDPNAADAHIDLGVALEAQGKLDHAIACYRTAIELDSESALAHYNLGHALQAQGKGDEAIAEYRKAIKLEPNFYGAHNNLGQALDAGNKRAEAIACFRKAIEIDPNNAEAHIGLGIALRNQKKLDEAIACYRKAIQLDPKDFWAHNNLGVALEAQGKLDKAIACYRKAIQLDPKRALAHANLGNALKSQGKLHEAIASYKKAIELDAKFDGAHYNLGLALTAQGKLDEAIACHRKAIELDRNQADFHYGLGFALEAQRKLDEAIACYRKAIKLDPRDALARKALGNALGNKGWDLANCADAKLRDFKRAMEVSKKAVEVAPRSALAWQYLGWVQYRAGNWKASIEALETSCKLQNPGDCEQWIVMSLAQWKLANEKDLPEEERARHKAEARRWYDQAAKQIDSGGATGSLGEAIRAFRAEAAELLGVKEKKM
jgi:tetratricopeptide (TPR) repeat protein